MVTSVFDLTTDASQLPSLNQGTSSLVYEQIQPLRTIVDNAFPGGEINFRFEVAGEHLPQW